MAMPRICGGKATRRADSSGNGFARRMNAAMRHCRGLSTMSNRWCSRRWPPLPGFTTGVHGTA